MLYREQEYVEKCFCGAPATRPCQCCGRARCEMHLERSLCNRCTQFLGRELEKRSNRAWVLGTTLGSIATIWLLAAGVVGGVLVAFPASVLVGLAYRRVERARMIRLMGPAMSASKGELPPPPRDPDSGNESYTGSPSNTPPRGGY